jgi:hypothetical protein
MSNISREQTSQVPTHKIRILWWWAWLDALTSPHSSMIHSLPSPSSSFHYIYYLV